MTSFFWKNLDLKSVKRKKEEGTFSPKKNPNGRNLKGSFKNGKVEDLPYTRNLFSGGFS
jgi:hypothetical protein